MIFHFFFLLFIRLILPLLHVQIISLHTEYLFHVGMFWNRKCFHDHSIQCQAGIKMRAPQKRKKKNRRNQNNNSEPNSNNLNIVFACKIYENKQLKKKRAKL